ncbi:hypothetical protein CspeluHIS016_0208940 [Cutaneotrichosporon spelunceum]|uniref:Uncharacterized protein n=1 Tax=Cutaneotrichosporon spelunceum TaxID=1672016 RepID=A0AAD3YB87_9TREE|nr:hypothetical protein CspeluHIS016_0208940 [Cutaneotrichosporon spelunceum]
MSVDICTLSTPALVTFLLLPSLLWLGTIATTSRGNLAPLQAAPLVAGSLVGLLVLRQPSTVPIIVIGALAIVSFLLVLFYRPQHVAAGHGHGQTRRDKPAPLSSFETSLLPWSPGAPTPTTISAPSTPTDSESGDTYCARYLDKVTASLSQCSRVISRPRLPPTMLNDALVPYPATPVTAVSSASTSASSTHTSVLADAQATPVPSAPKFEEEFVRYIDRTAARTRPEETPVPFGSWPKEWPVFWEGAGLASKGCW